MSNDALNRRDFLKAALTTTLTGGSALLAQEEVKKKIPYRWGYTNEDKRPVLVVKNPDADKDEIKLIIQGNQALVRSKNLDPENFFKDFIDSKDKPNLAELTYNTVIAYSGSDPKNPMKVIFQSGSDRLDTRPGDKEGEYKNRLIDHSGAHLQFIGLDSDHPAPVEFDMTRNHGRWHNNWVPTTIEFHDSIAPTLQLSSHMARCHHCEDKGTYFGSSQMEIVPKDASGMAGGVLFSIGSRRSYLVNLITRNSSNQGILAKTTILPGFSKKVDMFNPLKDLEEKTFKAMSDADRQRLEEGFQGIDRDIEGRAPAKEDGTAQIGKLTITIPPEGSHMQKMLDARHTLAAARAA